MPQGKFAALAELDTTKPRSRGQYVRKGGKRSNPDYQQCTIFIRRDSWQKAHERMRNGEVDDENWIRDRTGRTDFSALLQSLLEKWLAEGKKA